MDKKNQILMSVLGVFALVIVTVGVSYAFFSYSRVGTTTNTITSGDIQFTYEEGENSVTLKNAFPVADSVGAADETGAYTFTVSGYQTGEADLRYNVTLMSANDNENITQDPAATYEQIEAGTHVRGYFANDQIKASLQNVTTNTYVFGSATTGVKLSAITATAGTNSFAVGTTSGECQVVTNAEAKKDGEEYKLKLWIADDVDYSNTKLTDDGTDVNNDAQTSVGKFNGFSYSLKVKVDAKGTNMYQGTTTTPGTQG